MQAYQRVFFLCAALGLVAACAPAPADVDAGAACRLNSDCPLGLSCVGGACVAECREDRDCSAGQLCETTSGRCAPRAEVDASTVPDAGSDSGGLPVEEEGGGGREVADDELPVAGGPGDSWRPTAARTLACPWLPQVPPGTWAATRHCGPTSLVMANACITGGSATQADLEAVSRWMVDNVIGYPAGPPNGSYTNTRQLVQTAGEYYGLTAERFTAGELESLFAEISVGRPVVVAVETQGTNDAPSDVMRVGAPHFALLVGMTPTHVVLHDPGRSAPANGQARAFTIASFLSVWSRQGRSGVRFAVVAACQDSDADGYGRMGTALAGCTGSTMLPDCDDTSAASYPGASEVCGNGADEDCNGADLVCPMSCSCTDGDSDGHYPTSCTDTDCLARDDCDDACSLCRPGGTEICDGVRDENCSGVVDEGCGCTDGMMRSCGMTVGVCRAGTQSCVSGAWGACMGEIGPGLESCNGLDDDCDGTVDDGVLSTFYRDADGDGFGVLGMSTQACSAPPGYVAASGDCNDACATCRPGGTETCDGTLDENCSGTIDEGCGCTNGSARSCGSPMVGACRPGTQTCTGGMWGTCAGGVGPTSETCNGQDDDCDGSIDEMIGSTWYRDADGDGYGVSSMTLVRCSMPAGYASASGDCDDTRSAIRPGATEICDTLDNNCDGAVDGGCGQLVRRYAECTSHHWSSTLEGTGPYCAPDPASRASGCSIGACGLTTCGSTSCWAAEFGPGKSFNTYIRQDGTLTTLVRLYHCYRPGTLENTYQTTPCVSPLVSGIPADVGYIAPSPMGFFTAELRQCRWTPGSGGIDYFLSTNPSECTGVGGTSTRLGYVVP